MSDHILVKRSYSSKRTVYHEPSEENPDKPKCGSNRDAAYVRKQHGMMHGLRKCKECAGTAERPHNEGPEKYANKLEAMDPEAI